MDQFFFVQQALHLLAAQQQLTLVAVQAAFAVEIGAAAATPPAIIIAARIFCDFVILANLSGQVKLGNCVTPCRALCGDWIQP